LQLLTNPLKLHSIISTRKSLTIPKPIVAGHFFQKFQTLGVSKISEVFNSNPTMKMLRHKSFKSSLRYIHAVQFKDEDYEVTRANVSDDILALGKAGWQKYDETTFNGITAHLYRKP
jgi:hypothetical protein